MLAPAPTAKGAVESRTPESRSRAAEVLEAYAGNTRPAEDDPLAPDIIAPLSALVAEGKLSPLRLARLLRGEERLTDEIVERLVVEA